MKIDAIAGGGLLLQIGKHLEGISGKLVTVTITEKKKQKTYPQLQKIHAIIREIADEAGYFNEDMKFELKRKIKGYDTNENGKKHLKSFADYTKDELGDFISKAKLIGEKYYNIKWNDNE